MHENTILNKTSNLIIKYEVFVLQMYIISTYWYYKKSIKLPRQKCKAIKCNNINLTKFYKLIKICKIKFKFCHFLLTDKKYYQSVTCNQPILT